MYVTKVTPRARVVNVNGVAGVGVLKQSLWLQNNSNFTSAVEMKLNKDIIEFTYVGTWKFVAVFFDCSANTFF